MSIVHVYPTNEEKSHNLKQGALCECDPVVLEAGLDIDNNPAVVIVHSEIYKGNWGVKNGGL